MQYTLTLPAGVITVRNGIYKGSNTQAQWAPCNPLQNGGWKAGDTLLVTCTLNLSPNVNPMPPSTDYAGLCAGACAANNQAAVNALTALAVNLPIPNPGQLLGTGITTSATAIPSAIFYNCIATTGTFVLPAPPPNRGTLTNYIYQYSMAYNAGNTITGAGGGNNVEIVFGYGDPMNSEVDT